MNEKFDFSGWATKNDIKCTDGRTIKRNAFADDNGKQVPLVWMHLHDDPANVLGHAILQNRDNGVYAYCKFNNGEAAANTKECLKNGDLNSLSIYANGLKQDSRKNVLHGCIKEVSLVLAGANEGAVIDNIALAHGDGWEELCDEATMEFKIPVTFDDLYLEHSDDNKDEQEKTEDPKEEPKEESGEEKSIADVLDTLNPNQMELFKSVASLAGITDEKPARPFPGGEQGIADTLDSLNPEQLDVFKAVASLAGITDDQKPEGEAAHADDDGETFENNNEEVNEVRHNLFENDNPETTLSHADVKTIISMGKKAGSLRDAFDEFDELHHADYGVEHIDYLFPDARTLTNSPEFIKRETEWVADFMGKTKKSPFSRIKSVFANITADEARAKGYVKGKKKVEEVITLLKRTTEATTVYKKQKLDRDDIIDITDFDVLAWIKAEMKIMMDEELARAALIGDGRLSSSDDKIPEDHIRPIAKEDDLYSIKVPVGETVTDYAELIKDIIRARKNYKGSGNPTFYTTEDVLTEMLLLEDKMGRSLYDSVEKLATKLRVSKIVTVEAMESDKEVLGVIVNPTDYTFGADKGGQTSFFEDFDIDFNQEKYLYEGRTSGCLTKPYSAIVLQKKAKTVSSDTNV